VPNRIELIYPPINRADQQRDLGPMLGRHSGHVYDGDTDAQAGDRPWAVFTAKFAESATGCDPPRRHIGPV
jgi:hypothetical protein